MEEYEAKKGLDWQRTWDLTCREFTLSIESGGCGCKWGVLQSKLDELEEPDWCLIGQLWQQLFPFQRRIEENLSDEEKGSEQEKKENES